MINVIFQTCKSRKQGRVMGCYFRQGRQRRKAWSSEWSEGLGHVQSWLGIIVLHSVSFQSSWINIRPHWREACLASHSKMPMGIWVWKRSKNLSPAPNLQLTLEMGKYQIAKSLNNFSYCLEQTLERTSNCKDRYRIGCQRRRRNAFL